MRQGWKYKCVKESRPNDNIPRRCFIFHIKRNRKLPPCILTFFSPPTKFPAFGWKTARHTHRSLLRQRYLCIWRWRSSHTAIETEREGAKRERERHAALHVSRVMNICLSHKLREIKRLPRWSRNCITCAPRVAHAERRRCAMQLAARRDLAAIIDVSSHVGYRRLVALKRLRALSRLNVGKAQWGSHESSLLHTLDAGEGDGEFSLSAAARLPWRLRTRWCRNLEPPRFVVIELAAN